MQVETLEKTLIKYGAYLKGAEERHDVEKIAMWKLAIAKIEKQIEEQRGE